VEINRVYCEDCRDTMARMPDGFIDLTVTSPPYDNLRTYKNNIDKVWGEHIWKPIIKELYRVTKRGGVVVWMVGDATIKGSETGTSFRQALYFKEVGFNLHDTMIYKKKNPMPMLYRLRYTSEFEYMFVLSKGKVRTHNPILVDCLCFGNKLVGSTYKNFNRNVQSRTKPAKPVKKQKIKGNIWEYVIGAKGEDLEGKQHTAILPCALVHDHIISWSNEGDLIYDPFMGSGTTAKMAVKNNRNWIGSEISSEYCELIEKRIASLKED